MNVCLLVINYNGVYYLEKYLNDLALSCAAGGIELIISDSGSTDGSLDFLFNSGYQFTVTPLLAKGFANNVNHGIRYAMMNKRYDYFIISNNDVQVSPLLFPALLEIIPLVNDKFPNNGIIGFDEILSTRYDYFKEYAFNDYSIDFARIVTDLPGFFFILKKEVISSIGFFDEEYFMYGEDNDYFTRAIKKGFTLCNTQLPIMHFSEGSSLGSKRTSWYVYRNAFLFAQKNLDWVGIIKMFFSFINQIYNPFFKIRNAGNERVTRSGFFYNNYLLLKSILWNFRYFFKKQFAKKQQIS